MKETRPPVAVIGAGFSGTMTALQLLSRVPDRRILLCERGPTFARGAAYSTDDPVHLLNVRAGNMSAFPDRPDDFVRWLADQHDLRGRHVHDTPAGTFVSRSVYGRYLTGLVQDELASAEGAARLRIVPDEVVGLERGQDGGFDLRLAGGRSHRITGAVMAVGTLVGCERGEPGRTVHDPWAVRFTQGLADDRPVVVVGTGLTMVDVVVSLWSSGFAGPVVAISRRGLLPRGHVPSAPWSLSRLDGSAKDTLSRLVRAFRQEVEDARASGLPWQSVMDALRPSTASLWRDLGPEQQRRFIRHLRPWWDVHRHRMAPPVAQQLHGLIRQGYLRLAAGQVLSVNDADPDAVVVRWAPRGRDGEETVRAQRIVFATGSPPLAAARDTLLDGMLRSGLARIDRHGLGLDADRDLRLVGERGEPVPGLWGIGPIVRGAFWECTAVPDIRSDAQRLAVQIAGTLAA